MGVFGVILGIIAILSGLLATFVFGTTGFIITLVLAAAAIALGIIKRVTAKNGGIPAIVIGVIAILIGFGANSFWGTMFQSIHDRAVEYMPDSMWAEVSEDYTHGIMGIAANMPTDEASIKKVIDEMNELAKLSDEK